LTRREKSASRIQSLKRRFCNIDLQILEVRAISLPSPGSSPLVCHDGTKGKGVRRFDLASEGKKIFIPNGHNPLKSLDPKN
jgi:hypothetical protein